MLGRVIQVLVAADEALLRAGILDTSAVARGRVGALTGAGREVLRPVGTGLSNAEILARLDLGAGTVKARISRIRTKLDCANRVQAATLAHGAGPRTEAGEAP
ncbi:hypothetical protein GCM10010174_65890 [Kutzneria viridogrisea]